MSPNMTMHDACGSGADLGEVHVEPAPMGPGLCPTFPDRSTRRPTCTYSEPWWTTSDLSAGRHCIFDDKTIGVMHCITPNIGDLDFGSDHRDVGSRTEYIQFMKPATRLSEPPSLSTIPVETPVFCQSFHVLHLLPLFVAAYIFFVLHIFVVGSSSFRFHGEPFMIFFIDILK